MWFLNLEGSSTIQISLSLSLSALNCSFAGGVYLVENVVYIPDIVLSR